ncbi:MAG: aromatic-ring-hydroxylating dioxygenase subunit beta, partial [Bradyrhizobium sp.]
MAGGAIEQADVHAIAAATIYREARLLDTGEWADWVAMYSEDAVYWVPAWLDEYTTTNDPNTQVSLLYHYARRGLEERIARLERLISRNSGNSSMPPSADDLPGKKPPERRPRRGAGRKPGKQP